MFKKKRGVIEKHFLDAQVQNILGVDEVGRGCLAGPVYAACAALDYSKTFALKRKVLSQIRDSKQLSPAERRAIIPQIREIAIEVHVGIGTVREIEEHGIVGAAFLAMRRAMSHLSGKYDLLLIDGRSKIPGLDIAQIPVIKGDDLCYCIAAASIIAKEARDEFMREQALSYPNYGFERHVGYGTRLHKSNIAKHGICDLHRRNFAPIAELC